MEVKDKQTQKTWAAKIVDKQQAVIDHIRRILTPANLQKKIFIVQEKVSRGKTIDREIQILKIVNHPHIVYLDKIFESSRKIYLILEKCNVELALILKEKTVFSEDEARKVVKSLSSAVTYLHKYGLFEP